MRLQPVDHDTRRPVPAPEDEPDWLIDADLLDADRPERTIHPYETD
jgi:hypothetical protein